MAEERTQQQSERREHRLSRQSRPGHEVQRSSSPGPFGDTFDFFTRMSDEMDRTFDRLMRDFGITRRHLSPGESRARGGTRPQMWAPRIEAVQKDDQFIVRAELPGLKREDVQVELTEDAVTIHGERRDEHEEQREGFYHSERDYGEFYRTIPLPQGAIGESAEATFRDGVLEIRMQAPPAEANRGRRVEIKDVSS